MLIYRREESASLGLAGEFSGTRTRLLPLTALDDALFVKLYTDSSTMKYIERPLSQAQAARSFSRIVEGVSCGSARDFYWKVVDKRTGRDIGVMALLEGRESQAAEVGLVLDGPWRSKGYATDAIGALIRRVFEKTHVTCIHARHHPDNFGARSLMRRLGFSVISGDENFEHWQMLRIQR